MNRRAFLVAAGAAAAPHLIPSGVLAAPGKAGAAERLTVGHVGVGGMGSAHLGNMIEFRSRGVVNIAAVCDADEKRLAAAVKSAGPGVAPYRDYRYLLQRKDVDAVIIASPDHWHAVQCVHACESGKHVYVEKPASVTIAEGRAMVAAARKHNRVATMCNLGNISYLLGRKLHWNGAKEQVAGDDQANRLLSRPQRHPYHL